VLTGGDTGQSHPATVVQMSTASVLARKTLDNAAGLGAQEKHPVGYLKEQPRRREAGDVGVRASAGCWFSARHGLVAHTVRESRPRKRVFWVCVPRVLVGDRKGCGLVVG
jgi:hypothetical protein